MKPHLPQEASTAVGEQFGTTECEQNRAGGWGLDGKSLKIVRKPKQKRGQNNREMKLTQSYSKYLMFTVPLRRICQFNLFKKSHTKKKKTITNGKMGAIL